MTTHPQPAESRRRRPLFAVALLLLAALLPAPASALDLFARYRVTARFATADGKPMANAEVRVFAPGDAKKPAATGRTDAAGKFVFEAPKEGFWTAEARDKGEVARVMIRVGPGAPGRQTGGLSPVLVIGLLAVLVVVAGWYRFSRLRGGGKPKT